MIELNEMIRERTKDFANLIRDKNEKGETRDLIKKIGDLEAIYGVLKYDIDYFAVTITDLSDCKACLTQRVKDLEDIVNNGKSHH